MDGSDGVCYGTGLLSDPFSVFVGPGDDNRVFQPWTAAPIRTTASGLDDVEDHDELGVRTNDGGCFQEMAMELELLRQQKG